MRSFGWSKGGLLLELGFAVVVVAFTLNFTLIRMTRPQWEPATFEKSVLHTAARPFQLRALVPWTVGVVESSPLKVPGVQSIGGYRFPIEFLSCLALIYAMRALARPFCSSFAETLGPAFLLLFVLPFHYIFPRWMPWYYVYDFPAVLFFTVGLCLLYHRRWWVYYPLFVVATLNRETACFLTVAYAVTAWGRQPVRCVAAHVAVQAAIWFGLKLFLAHIYAANHGDTFRFALMSNLETLLRPFDAHRLTYPLLLSCFGFLWFPLLFGYRHLGGGHVARLVLVVPVFCLGMLAVGTIDEIRIYGEMIPIMVLAAWLIVRSQLRDGATVPDSATA